MRVRAGRHRALLISNSRFPADRTLASLEGPPNDAAELRAALTDRAWGLFEPADVRLVPERGEAELRSEMDTFFTQARPADTSLLYYSGHGWIDNLGKLYLCASDTDTSRIMATAINSTFLDQLIERSKSRSTIIVLDCCYSGAYRGGQFGEVLAASGRFVLASCHGNELADDVTERNQASFFTERLASALRGESAEDLTELTLATVFEHVATALGDRPQHPRLFITGEGSPVVARLRARVVPPPAVPVLSVSETDVELRDLVVGEITAERVYVHTAGDDPTAWTAEPNATWVEVNHRGDYFEIRVTPPPGTSRAKIYVREIGQKSVATVRLLATAAASHAPEPEFLDEVVQVPALPMPRESDLTERPLASWSETDSWARISVRAQSTAAESNHAVVGTAHILLGLFWSDLAAARVLLEAGVGPRDLRFAYEELRPSGGTEDGPVRQVDRDVVVAIVRMTQLALQRPTLGDDHSVCVLIALLQQRGSDAYLLLGRLGVDIARLRTAAWQRLGPSAIYGHGVAFADALVVALAGEHIRSGMFMRFPRAGASPSDVGERAMLRLAMSTSTNALLFTSQAIHHRDVSDTGPAMTSVRFEDLVYREPGRWRGESTVLDLGDGVPNYLEGAPKGGVDAVVSILRGIREFDDLRRRHGAEPPLAWTELPPTLKLRATLPTSADALYAMALASDGSWVAVAGADRIIHIWDLATRSIRLTLAGHSGLVYGLAVAPDDSWLASASGDGTIRIWDLAAGTTRAILSSHSGPVYGVAVAPDGTWLASCGKDRTVRIWDVATQGTRGTLTGHGGNVVAVAVAPDGTWMASVSHDHTVQIWDVDLRAVRATLNLGYLGYGVTIAPDGSWLASNAQDRSVRIWDPTSYSVRTTLAAPADYAYAVAISPNGLWLASSASDATIRIWDVRSGAVQATLTGHTAVVRKMAFAANGSWLVSAGDDGTVRIWGEVIE